MFDVYKGSDTGDYGLWGYFSKNSLGLEQGIFFILIRAAVIASGISFFSALVMLIIGAWFKNQKLADAKAKLIRVLVISVLIFAVSGFVALLQKIGLDY